MMARTLAGARVLVLRAPVQSEELAARIRARGGEPVCAPVLAIEPGDEAALGAAARDLAAGRFSLVALTSPNGVDALAAALDGEGLTSDAVAHAPLVACVGPGTAGRLRERLGVEADLVPETATTEGLAAAVPAGRGEALLPRADIATPVLTRRLVAKGYTPVEVVAYRTATPDALAPEVIRALEEGAIDLIAFGSSSTVRNFVRLMAGRAWSGQVVSIGPVTSATCRELGVEIAVEAVTHDLDGLVDALVGARERA